jgi:hypothetical protein
MAQAQFADWSTWSSPFLELQQINQAASEKIIRECISYYSDNIASAVKCTQTMQRVTSPEDFFSTQMKLLSQQGEKNLEFYQNLFQIYQDAIKNHTEWTEEKVSSAIKTAGKAVKKTAED